jgi:hypothetical protein
MSACNFIQQPVVLRIITFLTGELNSPKYLELHQWYPDFSHSNILVRLPHCQLQDILSAVEGKRTEMAMLACHVDSYAKGDGYVGMPLQDIGFR